MIRALLSAAAVTLALGGATQAATYNLTGSQTALGPSATFNPTAGTGSGPLMTVTASDSLGAANVTRSTLGLGVSGAVDADALNAPNRPFQIDGSPLGTSETITITFAKAVKLVSFNLVGIDSGDDFELSFNGGVFGLSTAAAAINLVNTYVTSFSIRASGVTGQDLRPGNDQFTLASVATVPVPAAGLMLLAGLGGLAALRRRKALV